MKEVDIKDLGTLVRSIESKLLVPALKGAEDKLRDKMFGCMSSRAAQSIAEAAFRREAELQLSVRIGSSGRPQRDRVERPLRYGMD